MRKVYLQIIVMVSFLEKIKSESAMIDILNEVDYNFYSGEGFDVEDTEMLAIEQNENDKNKAKVTFKVIVSVNEGLDIGEDVVSEMNYDVAAPEITGTEIRDFTVTDSK